jgi:hypothetical protein
VRKERSEILHEEELTMVLRNFNRHGQTVVNGEANLTEQ